MMRKNIIFLLAFILSVSFLRPWQSAQASTSTWRTLRPVAQKISPALQENLKVLAPNDMVTVIITLRQQADLKYVSGKDKRDKQKVVIRALKDTANLTQGRLKKLLDDRRKSGLADAYISLWIINGISITARASVINELAVHPDVLTITPDDIQISPALGAPEPNIELVNAPALWSQSYTGQGVVIASMDSGVDISHPDLASRWRGGSNSWFDPYGQHPTTPTDVSGHGTWTTGIMVAGDVGGTSLGVAPGAQWIAVKIFNDQGGSTATAIHEGFQWLLDPDGNPNTADAPHVVNNSWTFAYPGCNLEFELDLQSLRAADILPVFAAGNGGPYSNTSYSPSNNPSAFAVGAINNNGQIYAYSSRGPSTCGGSVGSYPDLVAPGVNTKTADLAGNYYIDLGTSFAAPHVAGGLALLLSAYPNLDVGTQEQALINSAVDLGASGPDDVFGYGRLDLLAAFNWLQAAATSTPPPPTATNTSILPSATNTPPMPTATITAVPSTATNILPDTDTPTPTAVPSIDFPSTSVLDTFDRSNGSVGNNWLGTTSGYSIASNLLDVGSGGDIFWSTTAFGANQEAFVTLTNVDSAAAEIDLILKSQSSTSWGSGLLEVLYDAGGHRVQVWTYSSSQGWVQRGADIPVTFVIGDQFGARAEVDGTVSVYRNGILLATRSVSAWTHAASGGYIGLWFVSAGNALLDDFGGGDSATTSPPMATATVTPAFSNTPTVMPTNTPTTTATFTAVPSTVTNTSVPPTATNTALPPTVTMTSVPPTATFTARLPTATNTSVLPTATYTILPPTATNTNAPLPTATFTILPPTVTNTSVPPTNSPIPPTPTTTPPPSGSDVLYLSSTSNGRAGDVAFNDEDILAYNTGTNTWSLYFDGSDVGVTGDVNAFALMSDGSILLSSGCSS